MATVGDVLKVSRDDIQDFPGDTIDLILEMQKEGWRAQRSNRNHVMLLAPDGETRFSASRNANSAKYLAEDRRRYNKAQGKEEVVPVKVKRVTQKFPCPRDDCNRFFNSEENLKLHVEVDHEKRIKCPDCVETFAKAAGVGLHRRARHGYVSPGYAARKAKEAKRKSSEDADQDPNVIAFDEMVSDMDQSVYSGVFKDPEISVVATNLGYKSGDLLPNYHVGEDGVVTTIIEPKPLKEIDFLDERDSWTLNLDEVMDMDLRTIVKVLHAAGLKLELRSWKEN